MSEYKEINELYEYCQKIGVQAVKEPLFDGFKIKFKTGFDVVQHNASYGGKYGYVEPAIGCEVDYTAVSLSDAKKTHFRIQRKIKRRRKKSL